jgi:hypothetical protein
LPEEPRAPTAILPVVVVNVAVSWFVGVTAAKEIAPVVVDTARLLPEERRRLPVVKVIPVASVAVSKVVVAPAFIRKF